MSTSTQAWRRPIWCADQMHGRTPPACAVPVRRRIGRFAACHASSAALSGAGSAVAGGGGAVSGIVLPNLGGGVVSGGASPRRSEMEARSPSARYGAPSRAACACAV